MVDVLRMAATASGRPVLVRSIPVAGQPLGEAITPDGQLETVDTATIP